MYFFAIFTIIIIVDQLTKQMIVNELFLGQSVVLIDSFLKFTHITNTGAAFGIFPGGIVVFAACAILVVFGAAFYSLVYKPPRFFQIMIGLIAGGAAGNLVDRIWRDGVVDFVDLGWWPIFNVADTAIFIGAGLLICKILLTKNPEGNHGK